MIKNLRLCNYQSHKDSYLGFSEGINVICGSSNHGKTALIRALNWVITNRPQGLSFKSSFADKKDTCKVTLEINNQKIVREKSASINQYEVGSSLLGTIGNDVPSEVVSAINMSDINIQSQFDKHFLLLDSAGEVGRTINKIVKLDNIDELISNITSKINSTNKELEIKKKDLDKLYIDLEKFKDFDSIEKLVTNVIETDIKIQNNTNIVNSLKHIIKSISEAEEIISRIETEYGGIEEKINSLEQNWVKYHTNMGIAKNLSKIIDDVLLQESQIIKAEDTIKDEETVQLFEQNVIKYISVKDVHFRLNHIIKEWEEHTKLIKKIEKEIEKEEKEFDNLLKTYGCPLCNRRF